MSPNPKKESSSTPNGVMANWRDAVRDRLGLAFAEPFKFVFDITMKYGLKWAVSATVVVGIIFYLMGWRLLTPGSYHRVAIDMLKDRLKHKTYNRTADVDYLVGELKRLTRQNPEREVHIIISGGPGAGKSELARQVGERIFQSENKPFFNIDLSFVLPPTDVITLNAEDFKLLQGSLEEAVDRVQGKEPKHMGYMCSGEEREIFGKFYELRVLLRNRSSLSSHPVIIFDNVNDTMAKFLFAKKPPNDRYFLNTGRKEHDEIRIIVTTTRRPTLRLPAMTGYKDLSEPMPIDEAVKLLNTISEIQNDDQNAIYLAKELGRYPKALADAAVHIQMDENTTYRPYLEKFVLDIEKYKKDVKVAWDDGREMSGLNYDYTAFTASVNLVKRYFHVKDTTRGRFYKALAFLIGYCGSPVLPFKFLVKYVGLDAVLKNYSEFEVKVLVKKTTLYDVTGSPERILISTHQITREASFEAINEAVENHVIEDSLAKIFEVLKSDLTSKHDASLNQMVEYTSLSFQVVDVVMSLVKKMRVRHLKMYDVITNEFCSIFLDAMAEAYLYWPNSHKSAVVMPEVDFLADMVEEAFKNDKEDIALLLSVLFFHNTGNQNPEILERIVRMIEDFARSSLTNVDQHSIEKTVLLINIMATIYRGLGDNAPKAQEFHQLALELSKRYDLENEKATSLHLLGIIHKYQKNFDAARNWHEEAVELGRKIFSPKENGRLAAFLLNLAVAYNRLNKFEKARQIYQETLRLVKEAYGPRDQRVARVLNNLSTNYYAVGKYHKSVEVLLEALSIHEEIHGDFHPNVAQTLFVLGFTYRAKGDLQESLETLSRSLKIYQQYYGNEHYHVAEVLHDLSNTQRELNMLDDALQNAKKSIDIYRKTDQENSPSHAPVLNNLGQTYVAFGDARKAQATFEEALEIYEKLKEHGPQEIGISETLENIAEALKQRGKTGEAKEYVSRALEVILEVHPETHPRVKKLRELENDLEITHGNYGKPHKLQI